MRKYKVIIIICLLGLVSCTNNSFNKQRNSSLRKNDFHQYILIVYMGEINHPVSPLLIVTDIKDSSYLKYIGESKEKLESQGFLINKTLEKEYMKRIVVHDNTFNILRNYIEKNNTGVNNNIWRSDNSTSKIILEYKGTSIIYTIDKSTPDYYINLIEETKESNNKDLYYGLKYMAEICNTL